MQESTNKALIDRYLAAYNRSDIEGMVAVLAPELRFENYSGGQLTAGTTGIGEFRKLAEQSKALFAEREQRITGQVNQGETLVADIAFKGRLAQDIPDGPPAGTILELSGTSEFSFSDGLIVKVVDRS